MDEQEFKAFLEDSVKIRNEVRETRLLTAKRVKELIEARLEAKSLRDLAREMIDETRKAKNSLTALDDYIVSK